MDEYQVADISPAVFVSSARVYINMLVIGKSHIFGGFSNIRLFLINISQSELTSLKLLMAPQLTVRLLTGEVCILELSSEKHSVKLITEKSCDLISCSSQQWSYSGSSVAKHSTMSGFPKQSYNTIQYKSFQYVVHTKAARAMSEPKAIMNLKTCQVGIHAWAAR